MVLTKVSKPSVDTIKRMVYSLRRSSLSDSIDRSRSLNNQLNQITHRSYHLIDVSIFHKLFYEMLIIFIEFFFCLFNLQLPEIAGDLRSRMLLVEKIPKSLDDNAGLRANSTLRATNGLRPTRVLPRFNAKLPGLIASEFVPAPVTTSAAGE